MKRAIQIADELYQDGIVNGGLVAPVVNAIQQIQLDAFKAGMTRAAEIAGKQIATRNSRTGILTYNAMSNIFTARDNLKEIPNEQNT
jgi:hypothetical protein